VVPLVVPRSNTVAPGWASPLALSTRPVTVIFWAWAARACRTNGGSEGSPIPPSRLCLPAHVARRHLLFVLLLPYRRGCLLRVA
jgi:hypothetical protein